MSQDTGGSQYKGHPKNKHHSLLVVRLLFHIYINSYKSKSTQTQQERENFSSFLSALFSNKCIGKIMSGLLNICVCHILARLFEIQNYRIPLCLRQLLYSFYIRIKGVLGCLLACMTMSFVTLCQKRQLFCKQQKSVFSPAVCCS